MKQLKSYIKMLKTALKNSNYKKSYAYLNFRIGSGFPIQTWKTENRFYQTMHHSMMSYEDLKKVVRLQISQSVYMKSTPSV